MGKSFVNKIFSIINEADTIVLFFCFFVFSLPFWKRLEFFTPYSLLDGRFIDYLTYSVFGFDIVLSVTLLAWISRTLLKKEKIILFNWKILTAFLSLFLFSFISLFFSTFKPISAYYIFSLLVFFVLAVFTYNIIKTKKDVFLVLNFFVLSMVFQSLLAIAQFFKNQSVGLSLLGEQLFSPGLSGVAKIVIDGEKHIRPYGTFSHPNILALFLIVAVIITIYLFIQYNKERLYRIFLGASISLFLIAILLTFSRIIWAMTAVSLMYYFLKDKDFKAIFKSLLTRKISKYYLALILCIVTGLLIYFLPSIWWRVNPFSYSTWDSLRDRLVAFDKSLILIGSHPLFGIGIGNFVIEIAYLLTGYPVWMAEPVHNTYMLILVEIGIFGLISYLFMLYYVYRTSSNAPCFLKHVFWIFVIYMFFDHCFWDIRQVGYLLFVFIGLFITMGEKNKKSFTYDLY